jgi:hypothetical protein
MAAYVNWHHMSAGFVTVLHNGYTNVTQKVNSEEKGNIIIYNCVDHMVERPSQIFVHVDTISFQAFPE